MNINPDNKARQLSDIAKIDSGKSLVTIGKVEEAINAYSEAQIVYPEIFISAEDWNTLCWKGSKHGYAAKVKDSACQKAVDAAADDLYQKAWSIDSRGLAKMSTGDMRGAIDDFRTFTQWVQNNINSMNDEDKAKSLERSQRRNRLITEYEHGVKFTPEKINKELALFWAKE